MKTAFSGRRPASVLNALRLLVFCLVIELLGFAFSGDYTTGGVTGVFVGAALLFYLLRRVHDRANWARFALVGLIGLGVVVSVSALVTNYRAHPGATVIDFFSTLLSLMAAVLLFSPASNAWFNRYPATGRTQRTPN